MSGHTTVSDDEQPLSERRVQLQTAKHQYDIPEKAGKPQEQSHAITCPPAPQLPPHDVPPRYYSTKPLIDNVTNSWRDVKQGPDDAIAQENEEEDWRFCDLEDEQSCPRTTYSLLKSRRFRRMLAVWLGLIFVVYYGWKWYLQPQVEEEWAFKEGFVPERMNGTYGIARGGHFEGTRIKDLDSSLVPGGEGDPEGRRRLVFVGDIHGCTHEFTKLLNKVGFNEQTDHLIAVGDVVSKGPSSAGVLDELIRLNADTVRGNHEDRLLEVAKTIPSSSDLPFLTTTSSSKGAANDDKLLRQLKPHHMRYMQAMPLMLRIPRLPSASSSRENVHRIAEEIIVVHAGLVPHVPFGKQDPYFVMNMRSINHRTHVPSATHADKDDRTTPWFEIWNWYNDRVSSGKSLKHFFSLEGDEDEPERMKAAEEAGAGWGPDDIWRGLKKKPKRKPQVVVYGHDSKTGVQVKRWSKGLDSGCVKGGELTAMVLDAVGRQEIFSVKCKDYRG